MSRSTLSRSGRPGRPHRGQRPQRRAARLPDARLQRLFDPARRRRPLYRGAALISPQQALRDQGIVRQVHAAQSVGRQIVTQQRACGRQSGTICATRARRRAKRPAAAAQANSRREPAGPAAPGRSQTQPGLPQPRRRAATVSASGLAAAARPVCCGTGPVASAPAGIQRAALLPKGSSRPRGKHAGRRHSARAGLRRGLRINGWPARIRAPSADIVAKFEMIRRQHDDGRAVLEPAEFVALAHARIAAETRSVRGLRR